MVTRQPPRSLFPKQAQWPHRENAEVEFSPIATHKLQKKGPACLHAGISRKVQSCLFQYLFPPQPFSAQLAALELNQMATQELHLARERHHCQHNPLPSHTSRKPPPRPRRPRPWSQTVHVSSQSPSLTSTSGASSAPCGMPYDPTPPGGPWSRQRQPSHGSRNPIVPMASLLGAQSENKLPSLSFSLRPLCVASEPQGLDNLYEDDDDDDEDGDYADGGLCHKFYSVCARSPHID